MTGTTLLGYNIYTYTTVLHMVASRSCLYQGTASEATYVALLAARSQTVSRIRKDQTERSEYDIMSKLVAYCSDQVKKDQCGDRIRGN